MKFGKFNIVLLVIILECLAITGALPLVEKEHPFGYVTSHSLFESGDSQIPLIGFLLLAAGITLLYTRHGSKTIQASAVMLITGLLLLTVFTVQALT